MQQVDEQLQRLESKLQLLLKEFSVSQKEIVRLQKENAQLKQQVSEATNKSNQLSQTLDVLKIKSFTENDSSKNELEKRINNYLKEIDKCLLMLQS
jgi:chromosome segregation ATPase